MQDKGGQQLYIYISVIYKYVYIYIYIFNITDISCEFVQIKCVLRSEGNLEIFQAKGRAYQLGYRGPRCGVQRP